MPNTTTRGDEIFVFGFSRGAYTARSLAGVIARHGLLTPGSPLTAREVYELYRQGKKARRSQETESEESDQPELDELVKRFTKRTRIRFIGIWDTVGTLGIPFGNIPGLSRKQLTFHNTRPSRYFDEGCQALALDEHRKPYDAALWTNFIPTKPGTDEIVEDRISEKYFPTFEQRWFVGAHSNVGGGYRRDLLAQVPLRWIQDKAAAAGLCFRHSVELSGREHLEGEVVDSFKGFLKGIYRVVRLNRRHYRQVGRPREEKMKEGKTIGLVETVNESIDPTVFDRWQRDSSYRPRNLAEWAKRTKTDLGAIEVDKAIPIS